MNKEIILYSTGCAYCGVIAKLLQTKDIPFEVISNEQEIASVGKEHGISSLPILKVGDDYMNTQQAIRWVNTQEANS